MNVIWIQTKHVCVCVLQKMQDIHCKYIQQKLIWDTNSHP